MKKHPNGATVRLRRGLCYVLVTLLILVLSGYAAGLILFRGPSKQLNTLVKYTLLETRRFGFIPYLFLSEEEVDSQGYSDRRNNGDGSYARTDASLFDEPAAPETTETPAEETGPKPDAYGLLDEDGDGIVAQKFTYKGSTVYILVVYDPSRVFAGTAVQDPSQIYGVGVTLEDMIDTYDALGGINAGGFIDNGGTGAGWPPYGITYSLGECYSAEIGGPLGGFDADGIFRVGYFSYEDCEKAGIRDAVSFGPVLIMNGEKMGYDMLESGIGPRTAIGQRQDKAVVMLAVDGRQAYSIGLTYMDCADILFDKYGCVNAINMDGGNSTCMFFNGEMINNPSNVAGGTRNLPTTWLIRKWRRAWTEKTTSPSTRNFGTA